MKDDSVVYGKNVVLGRHVVLEPGVVLGDNVTIGDFVIIKAGTRIGNGVQIGDLCVLGKGPFHNRKMALRPAQDLPPLEIGDNVKVGTSVIVYRGTFIGEDVLIGDHASIREKVEVGRSSIIGRNVVVEPRTKIGAQVTIQTSSYITSDMIIEDGVFIGPCCSTSNDKYMGMGNYKHQGPWIKRGARIGNNATLLPGIVIGEQAVVGAGAVITKDVPAGETVVGNPGRKLSR